MVYAATDPEYRAAHLEADLHAYYDIISTYVETCPGFTQFMQELEEKRILGMTMFSKSITHFVILRIAFKCFLFRWYVLCYPEPNPSAESCKRVFKIFQSL